MQDTFSSWDKKWFGFFAPDKEWEDGLPPFEAFVDQSWQPDDLNEIVAFLNNGECCLSTTLNYVFSCHICYQKLGNPSLQLTDTENVYIWMGHLGHYVANHHLRPPDNMVRHIRQKIKEAKN